MGKLHYGFAAEAFEFDDRTLNHLKAVILSKLRRSENFPFNWVDSKSGQLRTIWLNPAIPIHFEFDSEDERGLNRLWAEALAATANSGAGLTLIPEPDSPRS